MYKIKVTSISFSKNEFLVSELKNFFPNSVVNEKFIRFKDDDLINYLSDADAAIIGVEDINDNVLKQLPNLKFISKYGVGLNNIDIDSCKNRNVKVGWVGGVNRYSVAEQTVCFIIMLARNLYISSNELKYNYSWVKNGGFQIRNKKIGIIGLGFIGKEVARILNFFGCEIYANDIKDLKKYAQDNDIRFVNKKFIYENCDFITIHVPLTKNTKNLISINDFKKMKKSAFLINTSRGGIINENDLIYALENKLIAGAALDVYLNEPNPNTDLLKFPNLICTPHIAGNSVESVKAMGISSIENLKKFYKK
tara:strand:- start:22298 stop:23224 length:927 start_codon:yes stop_codon:yes gene_type:complete